MKKEALVIHCVYAKEGRSLPDLLEEAFKHYLLRVLAQEEGSTAGGKDDA